MLLTVCAFVYGLGTAVAGFLSFIGMVNGVSPGWALACTFLWPILVPYALLSAAVDVVSDADA